MHRWVFLALLICCSVESRLHHDGYAFIAASATPRATIPSFLRPRRSLSRNSLLSATIAGSGVVSQEDIEDPSSVLSQEQINDITRVVQQRAEARWEGDYERADALHEELQQQMESCYIVTVTDIPRTKGGGSTWSISRKITQMSGPTVLQLAHTALGLAVASSERRGSDASFDPLNPIDQQEQCEALVGRALDRLNQQPAELHGRKAADAAFWFAMAGGAGPCFVELLNRLADCAALELQRFGTRDSCRVKDVRQIMQRFAAAGLTEHASLQVAAERALVAKQVTTMAELDFFSDECLLMIWKFSTRQRKQRAFLEMARNHWLSKESIVTAPMASPATSSEQADTYDWYKTYSDPTKPLVIDIGCGMGVSTLGLATAVQSDESVQGHPLYEWSKCNFAGVDLSGLAIQYAQSLRTSWNLQDRLCFFVDRAENFLQHVRNTYPGPIHLCMVQFPTPYRLELPRKTNSDDISNDTTRGNTQLPESSSSKNFMVSKDLLTLARRTIDLRDGKLLVQSNCEDVAVWIRNTAIEDCQFESIVVDSVTEPTKSLSPTKRTLDWIAAGCATQRAQGFGWTDGPVLPRRGRTETEVACMLNGTPVHRCVLQPKKSSISSESA